MNENDIMHLLGELESSTKSAHKRIDEIKDIVESINQLTVAIKSQQNSIDNMSKRLEKIEDKPVLPPCQHTKDFERFDKLEGEFKSFRETPQKRWEKFVGGFITALASGLAGYILAVILK